MRPVIPRTRFRVDLAKIPAFHWQMAFSTAVILAVIVVGNRLTSIHVQGFGAISIAIALSIAGMLPIPLYWHEKGKSKLRDASLTIPWALILAAILPFPVAVAARLGMNTSLRDTYFAGLDQSLGVSVPGVMAWASGHWLGELANGSYVFLIPMIPICILLPALTGKVKHAQQFLTANLIAFAVGLPLFALLPAVGPWYGYHFSPSPTEASCQLSLMALRTPGPYIFQLNGVVCFPSFHVIWAILCARAVWCFWPLRIPVSVLSALIVLSTMTTGWHYFVDVLAGAIVASLSIVGGELLYRHSMRNEIQTDRGLRAASVRNRI
jgi:membrane-associated phospholipid phosphatase